MLFGLFNFDQDGCKQKREGKGERGGAKRGFWVFIGMGREFIYGDRGRIGQSYERALGRVALLQRSARGVHILSSNRQCLRGTSAAGDGTRLIHFISIIRESV